MAGKRLARQGGTGFNKVRRTVPYIRRQPRGRVPRGPRVHEFVRTCSSSNQGAGAIILRSSTIGLIEFADATGAYSGNMITMEFALTGTKIYINNNLAATATMPSSSEFTTLFDLYFVDKVEVTPLVTYNVAGPTNIATNAATLPFIVYAPDDDDSSAANVTTLQQYSNAKYTQFLNPEGPVKPLVTIYPKYASMAYNTLATTGYAPKRGFLNSTNNAVPHFGLKMAIDQGAWTMSSNLNIAVVDFVFKYHLKFKGTI